MGIAVFAASALVGCSSAAGPSDYKYPDLSLAQTKGPVQLLRNETASRIPPAVVDKLQDSSDLSAACLSEADDSNGDVRQWLSSATATFKKASQWRLKKVTKDLIASLVDQGWTARDVGGSPNVHRTLLSKKGSAAEIQVSSKSPAKAAASTSKDEVVTDYRIEIETHGPCVMTDGAKSDEVTKLEVAR